MRDAPPSFWTVPFGDRRLRLAWFASVAGLAGAVAYDVAEDLIPRLVCAAGLAVGVLLLAAFCRWVSCREHLKQLLLLPWLAELFPAAGRWLAWLFQWRQVRRGLVAGCGVTILLLMIRTEEGWRGRYLWNSYRHQQRLRGVRLSPAAFAPPAVSEADNFAYAPVVSTCYARMLDSNGVVKGMSGPADQATNRLGFLLDGGNPPKDIWGRWENGERIQLEALQRYYRDLADHTNLFPVPPQPGDAARDVLFALSLPVLDDSPSTSTGGSRATESRSRSS
jgi:hypothetical protein